MDTINGYPGRRGIGSGRGRKRRKRQFTSYLLLAPPFYSLTDPAYTWPWAWMRSRVEGRWAGGDGGRTRRGLCTLIGVSAFWGHLQMYGV